MAVPKTVWALGDAYINIYLEDNNGNLGGVPVSGSSDPPDPTQPFAYFPVLSQCFVESVTIKTSTPVTRRAVTGRNRRKIVGPSGAYDDVSVDLEHLLLDKATEFPQNVFNARQNLRIYFYLWKLEYSGVGSPSNDPFSVRFAKATSFSITSKMPEPITANVSFQAELLE